MKAHFSLHGIWTRYFTAGARCTATALSPHAASGGAKTAVVVLPFFVAPAHLGGSSGIGNSEELMCLLHQSMDWERKTCRMVCVAWLVNVMAREWNTWTRAMQNCDSREAGACASLSADIIYAGDEETEAKKWTQARCNGKEACRSNSLLKTMWWNWRKRHKYKAAVKKLISIMRLLPSERTSRPKFSENMYEFFFVSTSTAAPRFLQITDTALSIFFCFRDSVCHFLQPSTCYRK